MDDAARGRRRARRHGIALLAEEHVAFDRELAALVARSPYGQAAAWPVVETVQRDGICREVIAPAPGLPPDRAAAGEAARAAASPPGSASPGCSRSSCSRPRTALLVNELAMRPHNSGHWTIEGAATSQFEQHLRAVLDLPLGAPAPRAPAAVMANVLGGDDPDMYARLPALHGRATPA